MTVSERAMREPYVLPPMPRDRRMETVDERLVHAPPEIIFGIAAAVEHWPRHLPHYRWVRIHERTRDGGGLIEMAAWRPFGPLGWPTWWVSEMAVDRTRPAIRFRHVRGVTAGMDVEWTFAPGPERGLGGERATLVRIVHAWNGPPWPLIGVYAARAVIGPVFIHGIASRTLTGLARVAEQGAAGAA